MRKAIEAMLSYGLTYKQERIEQHTAHPYPTSPGGAGRWRREAPGAEGGKPRPAHKAAEQEADEEQKRERERERGEAEDEEAGSRENKAALVRNLYTYVLEPYALSL